MSSLFFVGLLNTAIVNKTHRVPKSGRPLQSIAMGTVSEQIQAARGSVIITVANSRSARIQPAALSLVQRSLRTITML